MLNAASFRRLSAPTCAAVDVGQHFLEIGGERRVVRVVAVIRPPSGVAHARIRQAGKQAGVALVSCAALHDRRVFLPLAEGHDAVSALLAGRFSGLPRYAPPVLVSGAVATAPFADRTGTRPAPGNR